MNNDFKHTKQLEELEKVTEELKKTEKAKVITVNGGWGSGKTTLVKEFLENKNPNNPKKYIEMNVWNSWYEDDLMFYLYMKVRNLSGRSLARNLLNTLVIVFLIPVFLYFITLFGVDKYIKDLDIRWKISIILVILIIIVIICVLCFLKRKKANEFSVLQLSILNFLIVSNKFNYYIYEEIIKIIKKNIEEHKIEYIVIEDIDRLTPKGLSNLINLIDKLISEEFKVTFLVLGDINLAMNKLQDDKSYVGSENFFEKIEHLRIDMDKEYITFYNFLTEMESTREEMKYISIFEKKQWKFLLSNIENRLSLRFLEKFGEYYAIKKNELHSENLFNIFVEYYSKMKDVKFEKYELPELNEVEDEDVVFRSQNMYELVLSFLEIDLPFSSQIKGIQKKEENLVFSDKNIQVKKALNNTGKDLDEMGDYISIKRTYQRTTFCTVESVFEYYYRFYKKSSTPTWGDRIVESVVKKQALSISPHEKILLKKYYEYIKLFIVFYQDRDFIYNLYCLKFDGNNQSNKVYFQSCRFIQCVLDFAMVSDEDIYINYGFDYKGVEYENYFNSADEENNIYINSKDDEERIEKRKTKVKHLNKLALEMKVMCKQNEIEKTLLLSFWTWLWTVEGKIDDGYDGVLKVKLDEIFAEIIND